jgi:hypothetical protein
MSGGARVLAVLSLVGGWGRLAPARAQEVVRDLATEAAERRWSLQGDLGATLASRSSTSSTSLRFARAQALGVGVDRRFDHWHLFLRGEANAWRDRRDDGSTDFVMTLDLGVGARYDYGGGRLRSSVAAGGTLLAVPTDLDAAGIFGAFVDVRPVAYAWPLGKGVRFGVVPLSLTLAVPVLTGIPLVSIQYRTTIFAERDF